MSAVFVRSKKSTLFTGEDASLALVEYIALHKHQQVLIISSSGVHRRGQLNRIKAALSDAEIAYTVFDDVGTDPTFDDVRDILNSVKDDKDTNHDGILAVGGGSVIDAAKAVALSLSNKKDPEKLVGMLKGRRRPVPLYCIPTTSGTGSEATVAAVIADSDSHEKQFIIDVRLVSNACALDPVLLCSVPPNITAMTGMDALTHAIEAYIGINGSSRTDTLAEEAIHTIVRFLPVAYNDGKNLAARSELAMASYQAGVAFTEASLGYVHAISHQLGAYYGVPHGLGNAIVLPKVLLASLPNIQGKLAHLSKVIDCHDDNDNDLANAMRFIHQIDALNRSINIPTVVYDLDEKNIPTIARAARKEAVLNYPAPKLFSERECMDILESCLA